MNILDLLHQQKTQRELELRQFKNGFVSVKCMLVLKLTPFFPCRVGEGKRAAISKLACVSQKRILSCIVLALVRYSMKIVICALHSGQIG